MCKSVRFISTSTHGRSPPFWLVVDCSFMNAPPQWSRQNVDRFFCCGGGDVANRAKGYGGGGGEEDRSRSHIVEWVWEHHRMEKITDVIDPRLNKEFDEDQARCILILGLACCHPNPSERPSIRTALQVLTGEVDAPVVPTEKPAFMWPPTTAPIAVIREEMDNAISGGQLSTTMELSGR
ncbi:hypothetical protein CCACVL1_22356 [Corchorus capsularis]|uniref:Uncharacterized protein n=1 Tax=Corchorus capsularis TaxID=210143 RepID=A0A1R3H0A3_COCAP|nr:hypothetical protein CCACVL1_22356 [Corchorus capsularis]